MAKSQPSKQEILDRYADAALGLGTDGTTRRDAFERAEDPRFGWGSKGAQEEFRREQGGPGPECEAVRHAFGAFLRTAGSRFEYRFTAPLLWAQKATVPFIEARLRGTLPPEAPDAHLFHTAPCSDMQIGIVSLEGVVKAHMPRQAGARIGALLEETRGALVAFHLAAVIDPVDAIGRSIDQEIMLPQKASMTTRSGNVDESAAGCADFELEFESGDDDALDSRRVDRGSVAGVVGDRLDVVRRLFTPIETTEEDARRIRRAARSL